MVAITGAMAHDFNTTDFVSQMEGFQASDNARQKLFADVLERYAALIEDYETMKSDYISERDIRRDYQRRVDQMQRQVAETHRELEGSSFVLALIDGDGVIFQDALLQAAAHNGGSEAASRLQNAIRDHIASLYGNSGNWPIMVQIYLSLDKLAQKLASVNLIQKPLDLRTFAQGFSLNQSLFTIVDVGQGKERADHKIKEMLRTFSDNPTCRHIIFGGCHDAGYLLNLDQYKHDAAKAARITLLESTPAWRGFVELPNFRRASFDHVFRNTPLPESYPHAPVQPITTTSSQHLTRAPTTNTPPPPGFVNPPPGFSSAHATANSSARGSPTTTNSPLVTQPTPEPGEASWATVGKTGVPPNENISIVPKTKTKSKQKWAYYNAEGYRLDEPLPPRDKAAVDALESRMKKSKKNLCNQWHLHKGQCTNGEKCYFQHEPKLSPSETIALRYKTKTLPCRDRYCEDVNCYLGHQCSFERDTGRCPFPDTCNLRFTHGMDTKKAARWSESGDHEEL